MSTTTQDAPKRLSSMEEFTAELNRVMPVVTRVARRFAPLGDADDVSQEACLAAWRYRHRFDPDHGSFQTWILKILLNESYKTVARKRRQGYPSEPTSLRQGVSRQGRLVWGRSKLGGWPRFPGGAGRTVFGLERAMS
ncbi:MAG: RNA polymerase sigma factor, partial [Dermatophilaceae bacterium]